MSLSRLDKIKVHENGCWLWQGHINVRGYGVIWFRGKSCAVHRVAWIESRGGIPSGMCVCHHCDNPICINPGHLFLGSNFDNVQDRCRKGRSFRPTRGSAKKLNKEKVVRIRTDPRMAPPIAAELQISPKTVQRVRRGETWRHVSPAVWQFAGARP